MSGFRDKESAKVNGGIPKLDFAFRLEVKKEENVPKFCFWNKEKAKNMFFDTKFKGVILSQYTIKSAYDSSKSRSLTTSPFFKKGVETVRIFSSDKEKFDFSGTAEDAEIFMKTKCNGSVKTIMCLVVWTEKGLFLIRTNMSIGIYQMDMVGSNRTQNYVEFAPMAYNPSNFDTKKFNKNFVNMAKQNPPNYASFHDTNEEISADDLALVDEAYGKYEEFERYIKSGSIKHEEIQQDVKSNIPTYGETINTPNFGVPPEDSDKDDLPF